MICGRAIIARTCTFAWPFRRSTALSRFDTAFRAKWLRYHLRRDKGALNAALRIFLRVVQQSLQTHCPRADNADPASQLTPRPPRHYLWAALVARIYEVFPLICPMCRGQMRITTVITFSADIHKNLDHIGVEPEAPRITPARGPPLWDECGAQEAVEGVEALPDWDMASQSPLDDADDQRTAW